MRGLWLRRNAVLHSFFFVFRGRRMETAARGTGTSAYNFVQESETFVHFPITFMQVHTTIFIFLQIRSFFEYIDSTAIS